MKTKTQTGYGIVATTVTLNIVDAIALAELCNNLNCARRLLPTEEPRCTLMQQEAQQIIELFDKVISFSNKLFMDLLPTDGRSNIFDSEEEWRKQKESEKGQ